MKLFLIDAYALIYRSYYAFIKNPRINSKGVNTSAIFGFINSLEDVLKRENPTHIAVAFDPKGPTFRHEAFEQYKAQREETPEVIRQSVPRGLQYSDSGSTPLRGGRCDRHRIQTGGEGRLRGVHDDAG